LKIVGWGLGQTPAVATELLGPPYLSFKGRGKNREKYVERVDNKTFHIHTDC